MAGFVLFAVVMRPVGGWLSDRLGAPRVLTMVLAVVAACAAVQAFAPDLAPLGTAAPGRRGDGQGGRPFHLHALIGMLLFASWPFTRLVNAFSAPVAYQRHRDARDPRRGWERVGRP